MLADEDEGLSGNIFMSESISSLILLQTIFYKK